ncbi:MAG: ComEC/Rec2 family competence protein [Prevotella sp.]|nr:ComEC/Rec2 family competence protein [Prevotella sp.]
MRRSVTPSAPLLRIAVSLVVGIVLAAKWPLAMTVVLPLLALGVGAALAVGRWPMVQSAMIGVCFVVLGMAAWNWSDGDEERRAGPVAEWFLEQREVLLSRYRAQTDDEAAYAVLAAMTLGDKSALTPDLRETYSVTGASHILALSGLHLGIIYLLLTMLMLGRRGYVLSQAVVILGIWAFALLTGLSTSVTRAATMLSVYSVFSVGDRGRAPLNVLSFTAIVLLLFNARALFDVGFQMSFLSVLSILLFVPLFERLVPMEFLMRHRLIRWLYSLSAVSVAAQLGVGPLIAFYFHRFSTYFLLSNFVVIPMATLILYGALLTFLLPPAGHVLVWLVGVLNRALGWLSALPYASIDHLQLSLLQLLMVYVLVGCLYGILRFFVPQREVS